MRNLAARLAMVIFVALGARAACGQQNQPPRYPLAPMGAMAPPAAPQQVPPMPAAEAAPAPQPGRLFEPGQIVARVGDKTILYGDVAPTVNMLMASAVAKVESPAQREALEGQREGLTKSIIQRAVQDKLFLIEFERGMPNELRNDAKKRAEAEGKLKKNVRNAFEQSLTETREKVEKASADDLEQLMAQDPAIVRLAVLMKDRGLQSQGELDIALREYGTTLAQQAKDYGEQMMGMQAVRTKLGVGNKNKKLEVTHLEMIDYYKENKSNFQVTAKARFEILTARFSRFNGDRLATQNHIALMGNEVLFGGTPFPAVAKKHSHEPKAESGGYYDWIAPGSLASKPIDQAVFSLEIDKLSQIIEDDQGLHILRVKERTAAGFVPFEEAQPDIRKKIEARKRDAERLKYFTELRTRTKIWTIYEEPEQAQLPQPGEVRR